MLSEPACLADCAGPGQRLWQLLPTAVVPWAAVDPLPRLENLGERSACLQLYLLLPTAYILMKGVHASSAEAEESCGRRLPHCPDMEVSGPLIAEHHVPTVSQVKVLLCVSNLSI